MTSTPPLQLGQPLGRLLVSEGMIDEADLEAALAHAASLGLKLGQSLTVLGFIDEQGLARALHTQGRVPCVQLTPGLVDGAVARELGAARARRMNALPINRIAGVTTVAMDDPDDGFRVEEIEALLGTPVFAVHAEAARIRECVDVVFGAERESERGAGEPPTWAVPALESAAAQHAAVLVIQPSGDHVRLHVAAAGCRLDVDLPPRACAAGIDGLLNLAAASESVRSAICAAITRTDPTTSNR